MAVWSAVGASVATRKGRLDAEYFMPRLLNLETKLVNLGAVTLGALGDPLCSAFYPPAADLYEHGDMPFLRCVDVIDFPVLTPDQPYALIPSEFVQEHDSVRCLSPGDLVITKVGTPCYAGLLDDSMPRVAMSRTVLGLRNISGVDPRYLCVYLRSRLGFEQLMRERELTIQYQLTLERTRNVRVLVPSKPIQQKIGNMLTEHVAQKRRAKQLIDEAEALVMSSLGLTAIDLSATLCYEQRFSNLLRAHRFGAEYFMPAKQRVLDALTKGPHRALSDYFDSPKELFQPDNARKDQVVRNFDLTDAMEPFLDDGKEPMVARAVGSTKKRIAFGDLVISRLRSYLREIAVVRTSLDVPVVASTEFIVLRPRHGAFAIETLLAYLRSAPVQTVLRWSQDGSNHPRFSADDLLSLPVPDAVIRVSPAVKGLVDGAIFARREAARLFTDAKERVEHLVLGGGLAGGE